MSDLHDLCKFLTKPIDKEYVTQLKYYLENGIPSTYTIEEAYNYTHHIEEEPTTTTTPLHLICTHVPDKLNKDEQEVVNTMVQVLLEYGAGWSLTDINNDTPGCILVKRNMKDNPIYKLLVDAGVRAELLLRKVSEFDMEVIEDDEAYKQYEEVSETVEDVVPKPTQSQDSKDDAPDAPSQNQDSYLKAKLEYTDDALITKDDKDGVMMSWETDIMKLGRDTLAKGRYIEKELDSEVNILNIGFGMGIIDTLIQEIPSITHYICEAHPDVLAKLKQDGWYDKSNVVILEGRWQDKLNEILSSGNLFFNGIYYDTFSEHYSDMLELFDLIVGLLKPHGIFSFFNGLGGDRQVIYDVYRNLVELDLANYGLNCKFENIPVQNKKDVWDDVKRSYWSCPVYYHPEIKFFD